MTTFCLHILWHYLTLAGLKNYSFWFELNIYSEQKYKNHQ